VNDRATVKGGVDLQGLEGLRGYLLTKGRDAFIRQFCRKLLGYALGRAVQLSDEPLLTEMRTRLAATGYPAGSVVNTANPFGFVSAVTGLAPGTNYSGDAADDVYNQNAKSMSLFTNNTWHATDALDLTLGLRYTREEKELTSAFLNGPGNNGCAAVQGNVGGAVGALLGRGVPGAALLDPAVNPNVAQQLLGLHFRTTAKFFPSGPLPSSDTAPAELIGETGDASQLPL
jgi:hypothetical protein